MLYSVVVLFPVLYQIQRDKNTWPFLEPVTKDIAPDYFDIIDKPMDISVLRAKANRKEYTSIQAFTDDFNLIVQNCTKYNGSASGMSAILVCAWCSIKIMADLQWI